MNQAISSVEKDNIERFQKMQQDGRKLLLKQQKSILISVREKDGQEVVKYHVPDDLAFDLDNEQQLLRARMEAASNKKKRKSAIQKD